MDLRSALSKPFKTLKLRLRGGGRVRDKGSESESNRGGRGTDIEESGAGRRNEPARLHLEVGDTMDRVETNLSLTQTTMSKRRWFPPEILDYTIDLLNDDPKTLRHCCLVTKSWVPRTRKHLFAHIKFTTPRVLESWKKTFPDPSKSPAYHTHTLTISCPDAVRAADATEGGWIPTFSQVASLTLVHFITDFRPFHKFPPTLKSLRLEGSVLSSPQIFALMGTYPLLEDLVVVCHALSTDEDDLYAPRVVIPSISPVFTGTLGIVLGMGITHWLLDLPNGLHFRKLGLTWWHDEDLEWVRKLAIACCDTLESLDVTGGPSSTFVFCFTLSR
jgi:hypothetical protein